VAPLYATTIVNDFTGFCELYVYPLSGRQNSLHEPFHFTNCWCTKSHLQRQDTSSAFFMKTKVGMASTLYSSAIS